MRVPVTPPPKDDERRGHTFGFWKSGHGAGGCLLRKMSSRGVTVAYVIRLLRVIGCAMCVQQWLYGDTQRCHQFASTMRCFCWQKLCAQCRAILLNFFLGGQASAATSRSELLKAIALLVASQSQLPFRLPLPLPLAFPRQTPLSLPLGSPLWANGDPRRAKPIPLRHPNCGYEA